MIDPRHTLTLFAVTLATVACNKDDASSSSSSGGLAGADSSGDAGAEPAQSGGTSSAAGGDQPGLGGTDETGGNIENNGGSEAVGGEQAGGGALSDGGARPEAGGAAGFVSPGGNTTQAGATAAGGFWAGGAEQGGGGQGGADSLVPTGLRSKTLVNQTPYIPAQCYTDTRGDHGEFYNTCYTCHTKGRRPDFIDDSGLQLEYAFPSPAATNPWTNLFENRTARTTSISDAAILDYVRESNYFDADGEIILAAQLQAPPAEWDFDQDGTWSGFVPDCYFDFDDDGFDRDPTGELTGWRAFAYYPFPTTHWPTNGSFADILIRLPEAFRSVGGAPDLEAYRTNLSIVEAVVKRRSVPIDPTDESRYGVDLDRNGLTNVATQITFDWAPLEGRSMEYVGDALSELQSGTVHLAGGLFPEGTEFLSSNRYLDPGDADGDLQMASRFKELRYAKKHYWQTYSQLTDAALADIKERHDFPNRIETPLGNIEHGVGSGSGWQLQGFIEDATGALRPQTYEESAFCLGCHGGVGASTDSMYGLVRKLDVGAYRHGWYHWSQRGMQGLNEPKITRPEVGLHYEYSYYLQYAGTGSDLRSNEEVASRFFDSSGSLIQAQAEALHDDVTTLLFPSRRRALELNKSYKVIVEDQSFVYGRDVVLAPATHVHQNELTQGEPTGGETPVVLAESGRDIWRDTTSLLADAVSPELQEAIIGAGMGGPDGHAYGVGEDSGIIEKSSYATGSGVYFPFPRRDTLPVRFVVQNGSNPGCYTCHRLDAPTIPGAPTIEPLALPATSTTEAGVTLTQLTTDGAADTGPMWSPDGEHIAWVSRRSGVAQIWLMDADGGNPRALTSGTVTHAWPKWNSASDHLTFWGYDPDTGESSILVAPIDGSAAPLTLFGSTLGIEGPDFSPDGSYVAFSVEGTGGWDIWIAASDASAPPIQVTDDPQSETTALWRPGSNPPELAYKACASGTYGLCTEEILVFGAGLENPPEIVTWSGPNSIQGYQWSSDGDHLAYTAEVLTAASGEDRISYQVVVDAVTTASGVTVNAPIVPSYGITLSDRGPVFSPDGGRVAYWAWDRAYRATLWVATVDGTDVRQITSQGFDAYPTWSADGTKLAFESYRSGNADIWVVDLD